MSESTSGYFGPPALMQEWETHVPAPVGKPCLHCEEVIAAGDTGTVNGAGQITHYACSMRMVVGSVGHQRGRCSCHGGTEEDPPGMTRKQAAQAALREWEGVQGAALPASLRAMGYTEDELERDSPYNAWMNH